MLRPPSAAAAATGEATTTKLLMILNPKPCHGDHGDALLRVGMVGLVPLRRPHKHESPASPIYFKGRLAAFTFVRIRRGRPQASAIPHGSVYLYSIAHTIIREPYWWLSKLYGPFLGLAHVEPKLCVFGDVLKARSICHTCRRTR